jgi:Family of unknown function (DUF5706)
MPDFADVSVDSSQDSAPPRVEGEAHPNAIHMIRTMQAHHVTLSAMADQKANIIIGVNSVIFALVVKEAVTNPALMLLAASSGLAAVLCMLAVVPVLGGSDKGPQSPPNLLFFAGFSKLTEAQWLAWLDETTATDDRIRNAMARDVYQLGQVLARKKYKFLGWGYRVFIGGLIGTFALFVAQTLQAL